MSSIEAATYNEARLARIAAEAASSAGAMRIWSSGMTVNKYETVISPLDGQVYQRITATGAGMTDPADDTTNYVGWSFERVLGIAETTLSGTNSVSYFANGATKVSINGIAIGVRKQVFSASGRGLLQFLGILKGNYNGGRLEVLLDGRVVFDAQIQMNSNDTTVLVGGFFSSGSYPMFYATPEAGVKFFRSVAVYYTPVVYATNPNSTLAYILRSTK